MPIRFITYSRVGMQRAGLLVAAVATASDRQSMDLDRAGGRLLSLVSRGVPLASEEQVNRASDYLGGLRLWKRYGHLRDKPVAIGDTLEVQDLWLADPRLPSATGAITVENAVEMPQLAVALRLLRDGNYTRTDRGRALLLALGDEGTRALRDSAAGVNPLVLPLAARLMLLAALLRADGDFLQSLWRTSPVIEAETFTRVDVTRSLKQACDDLLARARRRARTGADRRVVMRIGEWGDAVAKERGVGKDWGGGRPPDQLATLRLEPFVDLGVITREDRYLYRYRLSPGQREFLATLAAADDVDRLVDDELVALTVSAHGDPPLPQASRDQAWDAIRTAYDELRSALGFASFQEVVLLAAGRLAEGERPCRLELRNGIDLLMAQRRESPKDVRLGINRGGVLTYMKLSDAARTR